MTLMRSTPPKPPAYMGPLSKLAVILLSLPASLCWANSRTEWRNLVAQGWRFWSALPFRYHEERARHPHHPIMRNSVSFCASAAVFILKQGGLLPLAKLFMRIIMTEGTRGLRVRYLQTVVPSVVIRASNGPVTANRILVADARVPRPDASAGDLTTLRMLSDLCAFGYDVVFLPADFDYSPEYAAQLEALGVTVISAETAKNTEREHGYSSPAEYVAHEGHAFALFYFIRLNVAELLLPIAREAAEHATIVFHAPDLACLRELRQAELANTTMSVAEVTRVRELAVIASSDAVVLLSEVEKDLLGSLGTTTPIKIFPALYAPLVTSPKPYSARKDIFFLGGFAHAPNVDAAVYFAETIWPRIHSEMPQASFRIIGADATRQVRSLANIPGIKVDGFVPDLAPVLAGLRLGVAPLRFGAGLKGKVAMTMGAGIPCVCSPIASEGMGFSSELDFLHAKSTDDFVEKVVRLYSEAELWTRISYAGVLHVQAHFSEKACREKFRDILTDISPSRYRSN